MPIADVANGSRAAMDELYHFLNEKQSLLSALVSTGWHACSYAVVNVTTDAAGNAAVF